MAIMLEEESLEAVAMTLEDSVAPGGGACADARAQLKIKTRVRKKRVIFSFRTAKILIVKKKWTLTPTLTPGVDPSLKQLELRPSLEVVELRKNATLVGVSESAERQLRPELPAILLF
jgi:hypothetical protein